MEWWKDREGRIQRIADYMRSGCKERDNLLIGIELEHFVVDKDTWKRKFYGDENGVLDILRELADSGEFHVTELEGHLIGVENDEYAISIEPGAQFEISVERKRCISKLSEGYRKALARVRPLLEKRNLTLLTIGLDPDNKIEDIPMIPKKRYEVMNRYLNEKGSLARAMMRQSCALQVAIDYVDEEDFAKKYRVLSAMSPILYTLFDSAAYRGGEKVGHYNMRQEIWRNTDNDRCGIVPGVFDEGFGFRRYAEWILGIPPLFRPLPGGSVEETGEKTLDELLPDSADEEAAQALMEHAMSIVFPDVRAKRYLEVRMMDEVPEAFAFGAAAMIKGLMYSPENLERLAREFAPATESMVERGKNSGRDNGIQGYYFSKYFAAWGLELLDLAERGLPESERPMLAPLRKMWSGLDTPRLVFECIESNRGRKAAIAAFEVQGTPQREGVVCDEC